MNAVTVKTCSGLLWAFCGLSSAPQTLAETQWVGRFSENFLAGSATIPAPWRSEQIDARVPPTRYALRRWDGVLAVEARAHNSMALLVRPLTIDLKKTPILCWQWRIDAPVAAADMTRKAGDDYAARVYLAFAVPPESLSLATRAQLRLARSVFGQHLPDAAINYVWDNRHLIGTWQDNAYTYRARMLVLRSGAAQAGGWVLERRNVAQDFQHAFGDIGGELRALALASDTDNTGGEAHAGFADFRFVGAADDCPPPDRH